MKFSTSVILLLLTAPAALSFVPTANKVRGARSGHLWSMVGERVETDVRIPYDAAARLAYDEWRTQFNKGAFNPGRFEVFKANYEAITVANVVAKKNAREEGTGVPPLMKLNEFGDCTEEEFMKARSAPTTTGDVLGKALDAAQSQSEASSALKEAADALAEEEEALARKLGLESVEELEVALDSMVGISDDGGELETENIAGEARARAAYLGWCKEFGKKQDETRYQAFVDNFLTMEKFAKETGKQMNLNEYADCTEQEFKALTQKKAPAPAPAPKPQAVAKPVEKPVAKRIVIPEVPAFDPEALKKAQENEEKTRAEAEAAEKKQQVAKEAMIKEQAKAREQAAKQEAEQRAAVEKEKSARQAAQEKLQTQAAEAAAVEAIAAAREQAEREARQNAERRALETAAAEQARRKALEWNLKQQQISASKSVYAPVTIKPVSFEIPFPQRPVPVPAPVVAEKPAPVPVVKQAATPFFSSSAAKKAPTIKAVAKKVPAKKAEPKVVAKAPAPAPVVVAVSPPAPVKKPAPAFSFFASARTPAVKDAPAPEPAPVAPPAPKAVSKPAVSPFSFFAPAVKAAPAPVPAPVAPPAPKAATKAAPPAFSFFGSAPKKAPVKVPAPEPVVPPAPAPVPKAAAPAFSFFGAPAKKADPVKAAAPAPAPLPVIQAPPAKPAFSFFGSPPAPKKVVKKEEPVVVAPEPVKQTKNQLGTISLFFGSSKVAEEKPDAPQRSGTLSIFGGAPKAEVKKVKPVIPNRPGTLNLFGSAPKKSEPVIPNRPGTLTIAPKAVVKAAPKVAAKKAVVKKAAPKTAPAGVPTLSRWTQNGDGSITGFISGSANFRSGTKITTSPIKGKGASGEVVQTGSGSRYFLQ